MSFQATEPRMKWPSWRGQGLGPAAHPQRRQPWVKRLRASPGTLTAVNRPLRQQSILGHTSPPDLIGLDGGHRLLPAPHDIPCSCHFH